MIAGIEYMCGNLVSWVPLLHFWQYVFIQMTMKAYPPPSLGMHIVCGTGSVHVYRYHELMVVERSTQQKAVVSMEEVIESGKIA